MHCPKCGHAVQVPELATEEMAPAINAPGQQHLNPPNDPGPSSVGMAAAASAAGFQLDTSSPTPLRRRRRSGVLKVWLFVLLGLAALGAGVWYTLPKSRQPQAAVQEVAQQQATEGKLLTINLPVLSGPGTDVALVEAPDGAKFDPALQQFQWTPGEADGPGIVNVVLKVKQAERTLEVRFPIQVAEVDAPPVFAAADEFQARPEVPAKLIITAEDPDLPAATVTYRLVDPGDDLAAATIDAATGEFVWTPTETTAGELLSVVIAAQENSEAALETQQTFSIRVAPYDDPIRQLMADFRKRNLRLVPGTPSETQLPFSGKLSSLQLGAAGLQVFAYDSAEALEQDLAQVDGLGNQLFGKPWTAKEPLRLMRRDLLLVAYTENRDADIEALKGVLEDTVAIVQPVETPLPEVKETPVLVRALQPLYEERATRPGKPRKLFSTDSYAAVRKAFADEFEKQHDIDIKAALGTDYDAVQEWFSTRTDLKEELYTAIDSKLDNVVGALRLFNELRTAYPKQIERYGSLAIAISVVWDNERGVYEYGHHARRTHSSMPTDLMNGVQNFAYFVELENVMEGRALYVPWEFLIHTVNHRTPGQERLWAMQNYGNSRSMYGKCYSTVPYDTVMLQTGSKTCRLADKEYNLPNILQFGGVCAMQADYAARVGKSLGVPAAYVGGEARTGDLHAWVMWVELLAATPRGITFSLESHGRYGDDHYYIGNLSDPQTGRGTTDRILELRLHQVGTDALAYRHARRIMEVYPALADELQLDFQQRLDFLSSVVGMNPWCEPAWSAVAQLAQGRALDKFQYKTMTGLLNQSFANFARFPDFTLTIFDDLTSFETDPAKRIGYYYQLLEVYAAAGRPDLSFAALLKLSMLLEEADRAPEAIQSLAAAIQKYAAEGQYVPKMLDRLETLATESGASIQTVADFYQAFLPSIPTTRGNAPSDYCIKMYNRAVPIFQQAGYTQQAQNYQAAAAQLQARKTTN
ncbi:MAG: hypothetical protein KDA58_07525 [Planctomycetaceae bacterium]|nr:hypothetical protein [Planctomycetaceae bacterium]